MPAEASRLPVVGSGFAVDDLAVGSARTEDLLAPAGGWLRVGSWEELEDRVRAAGPGSTALILQRRRNDVGHAFALHHAADQERPLQWIEPNRSRGERLFARPGGPPFVPDPFPSATDVRALIVNSEGMATDPVGE